MFSLIILLSKALIALRPQAFLIWQVQAPAALLQIRLNYNDRQVISEKLLLQQTLKTFQKSLRF